MPRQYPRLATGMCPSHLRSARTGSGRPNPGRAGRRPTHRERDRRHQRDRRSQEGAEVRLLAAAGSTGLRLVRWRSASLGCEENSVRAGIRRRTPAAALTGKVSAVLAPIR
jgi:hypothetical protein